jgi:hypothetical protein
MNVTKCTLNQLASAVPQSHVHGPLRPQGEFPTRHSRTLISLSQSVPITLLPESGLLFVTLFSLLWKCGDEGKETMLSVFFLVANVL